MAQPYETILQLLTHTRVNVTPNLTLTQHIGMCRLPYQGSELHHRYKPAQVLHLILHVFAMYNSRQIKQLSPGVYLGPKSMLEHFLGCLESFVVLQHV